MFENPRRGRQARNFTTNVSKILDLKSPSEQIFFRKLSLGAPDLPPVTTDNSKQFKRLNIVLNDKTGPLLWTLIDSKASSSLTTFWYGLEAQCFVTLTLTMLTILVHITALCTKIDCVMQPLSCKLKLVTSDYQLQTQVLPFDLNSNYLPEADLPVTGWLNGVFLTFESVDIALNFLKINTDHYPRCTY